MNNIDYIKEIVRLSEGNKNAEVIFFVNNDTISEDFNSTVQEIESVKLDDLYVDASGTHYCGEYDIREVLNDSIECENDCEIIEYSVIEEMIDERYKEYVKKAILVSLSA